ncbi:MAG: DUF1599 domain-containing protein [Bacteroidetes bacterium]|nr:MAG: DUF1599 domain-containing protein [Bacteroidota bacterium]
MNQTSVQYDSIIDQCRHIFLSKSKDYGTSWRVMRLSSIADQIFIKAQRIRTIEEKGNMKVDEGIESEFKGIINYCVIGLIQLELKKETKLDIAINELTELYNKHIVETKALMMQKNHDYGEAWRSMLVSTFTDMILMRLLRIRQIQQTDGVTIMSEGVEANLQDMINYSVFALIHLSQ